jgi:hypothetical protein
MEFLVFNQKTDSTPTSSCFFSFCSTLETKSHEFLNSPKSEEIEEIRQLWDWSDLYEELPNLLVRIGVTPKN